MFPRANYSDRYVQDLELKKACECFSLQEIQLWAATANGVNVHAKLWFSQHLDKGFL